MALGRQPTSPPVPESEAVGVGTKRISATRCVIEGNVSFATKRPYRYRAKLVLQSRRPGSRKWLALSTAKARKRGKPDSRGHARARVATVASLRGETGRRSARGDVFRATAIQRVRIDGGLLERTDVRNRVRPKPCEPGVGSRFAERSLTSALRPPTGGRAKGTATITMRGRRRPVLSIRARLPQVPEPETYEVWLYDDQLNAVSLGAQLPDSRGRFRGSAPVPSGFRRYAYVDISRERIDTNRGHSGRSVLRGPAPVDR